MEQIVYFARLKDMSKAEAQKKALYWLKHFDIEDWKFKKVEELSKGMQQKVQFILTILHEPELVILDEPFSGFDPVNTEWPPKFSVEHKDNDVWAAIEDQPDIIHYSIRGGAYNTKWEYVRCADRYQEKMNLAWQGHGFRPIRVAATK